MEPQARPLYKFKIAQNSSELAEHVLSEHGPQLHLNDIVQHMTALGWKASGDGRRDYKTMHQNLSSKPKRFRTVGYRTGIFELLPNAKKKER